MVAAPPSALLSDVPVPDASKLVTEDDTPLDNLYSEKQQRLLTESLYASWPGPPADEGGYRPWVAMANVGLFVTAKAPPLVPDTLVSVDVTLPDEVWSKEHRSYFVWEYGKVPDVVIEVVSNREGGELDTRRRRYALMRVPFYVVWDPEGLLGGAPLHAFKLVGNVYAPEERAWVPALSLELLPWEGSYEGLSERWLRWRTADGVVIPTGAERAEVERERAERLAARLRALGVDPDAV